MPDFSTVEHPLSNTSGRAYRLRVWTPTRPATSARMHTLLLLDGQWLDDTLDAAFAAVPHDNIRVASLGYHTADRSIIAPWRTHDYTPAGPGGVLCDARKAEWPCGGADALLGFLQSEVLPRLSPAGSSSDECVALFGHSYAGLFSLYSWLQAPGLFSRVYTASPSLWWYWPHMLAQLQARHPGHEVDVANRIPVHMLVGTEERWRPQPGVPGEPREMGVSTVPFAQRFQAALQASGHEETTLRLFAGQAHGPMLHSAACFAIEHFARVTAAGQLSP
ncbi:alpha/beta hydrolase [Pusillimonas sp. ANT_WB101]|uniref:alpha/beta hydrolase n=1 Tax=Pusillimonas sp. ANT_WB101 TaxID=2597356 RepID=UPI0011F06300|nr:alpha/beta hydrolase-fold protein [Pusillimonas sp. ANT_WB101]KAA0890012.1 alpha/beta hydrolase [Pusillimonas sp. ANT_WB101]